MYNFRKIIVKVIKQRLTLKWRMTLVIAGLLLAVTSGITAQTRWQKERLAGHPVVCHASGETGHSFIPPPPEFLSQLKSAVKTSDIVVRYDGFPDSVRAAFEYAVEIWESLLSSSVPIYMDARWEVLGSTTLGSCGANYFYRNFEGAPLADTYYPTAIVEKITRKELTGQSDPDMSAYFNSSVPWYFGTDGKAPSDRYDFVSTVLHEIAHGLGFTGFMGANTSNLTGYYDLFNDDLPAVFDTFIEDFNGRSLTDRSVYANPSNDLYKSMVSNQLYSGSPVAYAWGFDNRPRLYAPFTFKEGSSIYHLNDQSYPYGTVNALMTPSAGKGEVIHSPGPFTSGILADLGWKHLYFDFVPLKDREETGETLGFNTSVVSDMGIADSSLFLIYSMDGFRTESDSIALNPVGKPGNFGASLDPGPGQVTISYYLTARDSIGRLFTFPSGGFSEVFTLRLGPDTVSPRITHEPLTYILSTDREMAIEATVSDNIGVDSVYAVFYINGVEWSTLGLTAGGDSLYKGTFLFGEYIPKGGDTLEYVIMGSDQARVRNISRLPAKERFSLPVEEIFNPVTSYTTGFDPGNSDFILDDFQIAMPFGFDNPALHSPHPYPSPDADEKHFNLTTILRFPVVVAGNGRLAWDEVVLVEPGEEGALFGSEEFWDYVIAEGSKDHGKSWLPLLNGYDSGSRPQWESSYNLAISGNNSSYKGTKGLFARREFSITQSGNFKEGDTILVRFRLYSDPYAHGWGWAIDNLDIQQNLVPAATLSRENRGLMIWPNPAGDHLQVAVDAVENFRSGRIEITDLTGRTLRTAYLENRSPGERTRISLEELPAGVYLVIFRAEGTLPLFRKFIKL